MSKTQQKLSQDCKSGFTLVELSIAMAFIAILLIAIAVITSNIVAIYQKGITIKAVNSVGRGLIDEFTSAINTAPSVDTTSICNSLASGNTAACKSDHAFKYIYQEQRSTPDANGNSFQYNGIFCTGYYSYLWNTYYGEQAGRTVGLRYRPDGALGSSYVDVDNPRMIRIVDRTYRLCSAVVDQNYQSEYDTYGGSNYIDIQTQAGSSPTSSNPLWNPIPAPDSDFLSEFELDLMLYNLNIFPISQDAVTLRTYISGTFILATLRGNIDITRSGDYCDIENGEGAGSTNSIGSEFNYCAINKFNFAARTAGSGV